jgi:hypothetical protein
MSPNYIRPVSRDLGTGLPDAKGVCVSGSVAGPDALPHCLPGGLASGGFCQLGNTVTGCQAGGIPDADTCITGGNF